MKENENKTTYNKNSNDGGILEMEVTDTMRGLFSKEMGFEIEMLSGEYRKLPNGLHFYKITIPPEKEFIVKIFFEYLLQCNDSSVKIMSYPINNN